jgi:hypothetical protein
MADVLQSAMAWLAGEFKAYASQTVGYSRGTDTVYLLASLGSKLLKLDDGEGGFRIEWTDMDFLIPVADFQFASNPGVTIVPQRGDLVIMTLTTGADEIQEFEVRPYGADPSWRWCEPYQNMIRVHTKFMRSRPAPSPLERAAR